MLRRTRRDELLDALADHVQRYGLEGASVRNLAAAAGVAHNTLTHHFGTRSELVTAIFERLAQRVADTHGQPLSSAQFQRKRLHRAWAQLAEGTGETLWPVFFEILGTAIREPDQHQTFLNHLAQDWVYPLADDLVRVGQRRKDALALATLVIAAMRGLIIDSVSGGDPTRIAGALDLLSQFATANLPDA